ncbi:hypothetical protein [Rhodococcus opacus]|uniref:hypothetical protein n=1 Tax=Rhodococcus opacus TaxID=37919 RepID=UPI003CD00999
MQRLPADVRRGQLIVAGRAITARHGVAALTIRGVVVLRRLVDRDSDTALTALDDLVQLIAAKALEGHSVIANGETRRSLFRGDRSGGRGRIPRAAERSGCIAQRNISGYFPVSLRNSGECCPRCETP